LSEPKLRIPASGLGGSGYKNPVTGEKVPGVTTVLGVIDKPGLIQWNIDNTAWYAVANIDALLNRTEEQGFHFLRYYTKRMKPADFDDPTVDIHDYSTGVLNDLANLGTLTHEYIEADLNGWFEPDLTRVEQAEMVEQYLFWRAEHEIEVFATEATLFGSGFAGTADILWRLTCLHEDPCVAPGTPMLVDAKTSRRTWDEHKSQLAALGSCDTWMREVSADTPGAQKHERTRKGVKEVSWWIPTEVPPFSAYGILHLRPNDWDNNGNRIEAFCKLKVIPQDEIDVAFEAFEGALIVRKAHAKMKALMKSKEIEEDEDDIE
jgi:hypothetical protein